MTRYDEDTLVQQTTADCLEQLGWESVFAFNKETYGQEGTLGRESQKDVVLTRYLGEALVTLNPGLPDEAYQDALRQIIKAPVTQNLFQTNREKYNLLRDGVKVQYQNSDGQTEKPILRVLDFDNPGNNHFLCVRELWIKGDIYSRRADIVGYVNGLPLLFMECKNVNKNIRLAYEQNFSDYKDTVPLLFHHNAFVVLGNGVDAKIGAVSSKYEHFNEWKRLAEEDKGVVDMETLLKGVCDKRNFLDLFENFIVFDDSAGEMTKIIARNHQYLGVNRAIDSARDRKAREGKLGVFWHTQGSGKSYSMVFFTRKIHRKMGGNFTFLVCTDRDDLDGQIYRTYAGCGLVDNDRDECRAASGDHLKSLLAQHKGYVFTLIQKFHQRVNPDNSWSNRDDIIVITDEAHRTQYGDFALNMRNALPDASLIGFTGTPLMKDDEATRRMFGDYISTYDFKRASDDKATVPLYYDSRGEKLGLATNELNMRIAKKIEELEVDDIDTAARLEQELKRDYPVITSNDRLEKVAKDFVQHYSTLWETGKAMLICIDKVTCVRMHGLIAKYWDARMMELEKEIKSAPDEQEAVQLRHQLAWMQETRMAVVISAEQGEVDKFRKWDLDIRPYRKLIKEGFETEDGKRIDIETAFKKREHPFRVAIVCAMWLTGFDVKSLANLYLDKPLREHSLMQAIARANRVDEGKTNGLIIDYCGILKNLRRALVQFAGVSTGGYLDDSAPEVNPVKPEEDQLEALAEAIEAVRAFLESKGFQLENITDLKGFERNKAILDAKELVNENEETRKRFEIICREVFRKFKSCLTIKRVNDYRNVHEAIRIIYKSLQDDVEKVDISDIIRILHGVIAESIETRETSPDEDGSDDRAYDISSINFDMLRKEFKRSRAKNTATYALKEMVEARLAKMLAQNPTRTNFQEHYEKLIAEYNAEKDRVTIEQTFDALIDLTEKLNEEESRAVKEGLDEETLALFDLLLKPDISKRDIEKVKRVAVGLYETLKAEIDRIHDFAAKESSRAAIKVTINNYLWSGDEGLPDSFGEDDIKEKTDAVFAYLLTSTRHDGWVARNGGVL